MTLTYSLADVAPYINWLYFDHAWGMDGKPRTERMKLREEARQRLDYYAEKYQTHAVFRLFDAFSDGDDIIVEDERKGLTTEVRIPCLRQQLTDSRYLCLSDFIAPKQQHNPDTNRIGIFAVCADEAMETDFDNDPYERMMMQLLADRLAEATAERMHEEVRKKHWGYACDEQLSIADMLQEQWQGIRPAVGYPSLPDTSLNFLIDELVDMQQIGIRLTESGAMKPHASVSGLMIAHPKAHYFNIGKIGEDQLRDYARRRGMNVDDTRKFLQAIL